MTIANNTLVNNTHGIEIGFDNNGNYNKELKDITIANNLVTGSENSLITYMDGNTNEDEITWSNNVFFPTGNASLTSDNSVFLENEISVLEPLLVYDGTHWKSTADTPTQQNEQTNLIIDQDIDGQFRPELSTVGADHFSTDDVLYRPLFPEDVGPNSGSFTSTNETDFQQFLVTIFPNPTAEQLRIEGVTEEMETLEILTLSGKTVLEKSLEQTTNSSTELYINQLSNGFYIIRILGKTGYFAQKILITK